MTETTDAGPLLPTPTHCKICGATISTEAAHCFGCGHPIFDAVADEQSVHAQGYLEFLKRHSAWPTVAMAIVATSTLAPVLGLLTLLLVTPDFCTCEVWVPLTIAKFAFVQSIAGFAAMWVYYFTSLGRIGNPKSGQTLRLLLKQSSSNWQATLDASTASPNRDLMLEKASSSVVQSSLLAASSMFLLNRGLSGIEDAVRLEAPDLWVVGMLATTVFASSMAFLCFVISVDMLDSVFNSYSARAARRLIPRFYNMTTTPRYAGFVSLLFAVLTFVAETLPAAGTALVGIVFWVGWEHWFPQLRTTNDDADRNRSTTSSDMEDSDSLERSGEADSESAIDGISILLLILAPLAIQALLLLPGFRETPAALWTTSIGLILLPLSMLRIAVKNRNQSPLS